MDLLIAVGIASENGLQVHNLSRNRRALFCLSFPYRPFRVWEFYARPIFLFYSALVERTLCPVSSYSIEGLCAGPNSLFLPTLQFISCLRCRTLRYDGLVICTYSHLYLIKPTVVLCSIRPALLAQDINHLCGILLYTPPACR